jgi:hypothetical protein
MADDYVDENGRIRWIEERDLQATVADLDPEREAATLLAALLERERKRAFRRGLRPRPTAALTRAVEPQP